MNIYQHGLQDLKQLGNPHLRKFSKVPELVSLWCSTGLAWGNSARFRHIWMVRPCKTAQIFDQINSQPRSKQADPLCGILPGTRRREHACVKLAWWWMDDVHDWSPGRFLAILLKVTVRLGCHWGIFCGRCQEKGLICAGYLRSNTKRSTCRMSGVQSPGPCVDWWGRSKKNPQSGYMQDTKAIVIDL
jgi:hypothetical protein